MITTLKYGQKELATATQRTWSWFSLLIVLGYEGAGCLIGGTLLILSPDGRLMAMPVELMKGVFENFLIPGIILFGLGILNTVAFVFVMRNNQFDWLLSALALTGMTIWFIVEIIVIQELHWLHLMWGMPVFWGYIVAIPFFVSRYSSLRSQRVLLFCGVLSSLWYGFVNILVPFFDTGYHVASQTVSELSAIGAPTRQLWVLLVILYPVLFAAFGWGIRFFADTNRSLRIMGSLVVIYSVFNFYWPPMHTREVIAAGGGTLTDTLHITWAIITVILMMVLMGFGAGGLGKSFRVYTLVTMVVFVVCGALTFMDAPAMEANLPTPFIGIWERINIAAFMIWILVFANALLSRPATSRSAG